MNRFFLALIALLSIGSALAYHDTSTQPEYYHVVTYGDQYGHGYATTRVGADYSVVRTGYQPTTNRCIGSGCGYWQGGYQPTYGNHAPGTYYGNYCGSYWCDRRWNDQYNAVYHSTYRNIPTQYAPVNYPSYGGYAW